MTPYVATVLVYLTAEDEEEARAEVYRSVMAHTTHLGQMPDNNRNLIDFEITQIEEE